MKTVMKKLILFSFLALAPVSFALAQSSLNRYEAELLKNPNPGRKDTREVNAVVVFEQDAIKILSRRTGEVFKEFPYKNIKYVEHSFSKNLLFSNRTNAALLVLFPTLALLNNNKEKHWLTITGESDFAVLKIEIDNYRLIKMEFVVRNVDIININEDRQ
jgi:hypothetical protein